MDWKDTVMDKDKLLDKFGVALNENILNRDERLKVMAEAQAEISFKIGKTAGVAESLIPALKAIEASHKAGIREVVEWVSDNIIGFEMTSVIMDMWQAKLKEWGIEKLP